jgi:predicted hydrocarbon binding protein
MTGNEINDTRLIGLGAKALHQLRLSLENDLGDRAATFLQEAGYAAGDDIYDSFSNWLSEEAGLDDPSKLDTEFLSEMMSRFFDSTGWGTLDLEQVGEAAMIVYSDNWAEADPSAAVSFPSCHLSTGMLADFLTRMAGETVAVMEVECRSRRDARCAFLIGSPVTLQTAYELLRAGRDYKTALIGAQGP